jgi:hypothetical protein
MNLAHPDFQLLFDWLVKMSKDLLKKQGEFLPHGAVVTPEGRLGVVGAQTKEEQPGAHKTLQILEDGLRRMAAK